MNKSSICELQELMVKHKKAIPTYDCIEDKIVENNVHEFTIKVTCDNFTACGTGFNKKVAKENAAKSMLANFKNPSSSNETLGADNVDSSSYEKRKSAICELQELLLKNKKSLPKYDCIVGSVLENTPHFTFKVTCYDATACGSGSNKREAKENAAKEMLTIMKMNPCSKETEREKGLQKLSTALFTGNELKNVKTANASDDKTNKSAISQLQELMIKTKQMLPKYENTENKAIGPNLHEFVIRVTCGNLTASGTGPRKKVAKENAAKEMLALLQKDSCCQETEKNVNKSRKRSNDSPIFLLEEIMVKRGRKIPIYETVEDNHEKGYCQMKVTCEDNTIFAIGNNKDEATTNAARNMLNIVGITGELEKNIPSPEKLTEVLEN